MTASPPDGERLATLQSAAALRGITVSRMSDGSQGRRLIAALKRRAHTYREMLQACESCSPWKRVAETLQPHEQLVRGKRGDLVTWRVIAATRFTA